MAGKGAGTSSVSALLITYNDAKVLPECLESILNQSLGQIVVVDGGSTDGTIAVADRFQGVDVVSSRLGMKAQSIEGSRVLRNEFVFVAEADHVYPDGFVESLLAELLESDFNGLQGRLDRINTHGFFERGHSAFLRLHNGFQGKRAVIACPQMWRTSDWLALLDSTTGGEGFSFDTERGEAAERLGYVVGVGNSKALEGGEAGFRRFLKRHKNYGFGDADFVRGNWKDWSWRRRAQSLNHVPKTYFVKYPRMAISCKEPVEILGYLWLIGLTRYAFFLMGLLRA